MAFGSAGGALARVGRLGAGALRALLDLALPRACGACGRMLDEGDDGVVCGRCWSRLAVLPSPRCVRCGHPRRGVGECTWCAALPPYVRAVRSVCWAGAGSGSAIVHALKYRGWHAAAAPMAARMARLEWPDDVTSERAALVPVPLAVARERERGFNQSACLADALSRHWKLPTWPSCIMRIRATTSQTRLTPGERRSNVSHAFRVSPSVSREALRGAHLVLVDDVVTTAATVVECAAALHAGGARIVSVVTFARAPALGDRV